MPHRALQILHLTVVVPDIIPVDPMRLLLGNPTESHGTFFVVVVVVVVVVIPYAVCVRISLSIRW